MQFRMDRGRFAFVFHLPILWWTLHTRCRRVPNEDRLPESRSDRVSMADAVGCLARPGVRSMDATISVLAIRPALHDATPATSVSVEAQNVIAWHCGIIFSD
jgi:hypothetical protein